MIKFSIAGYYRHYKSNIALLTIYRTHRNWFYDNIEIDSVYGCLPGMLWSGCRIIPINADCNPYNNEIYRMRDEYYSLGITLRHTFQNCALTPEMFQDYRSLQWTAACEREGNAIILTDNNLKEFLQKRFPKYSYIWSTSLCLKDINRINQLSEDDMVVLDYSLNTSPKLQEILHPHNIEIMLSEDCQDNCPLRKQHYELESRIIINDESSRNEILECLMKKTQKNASTFYQKLHQNQATLTNEQIIKIYNDYGINHFKIAGRDYTELNYIESLVYYLVKPEYRDHLRQLLLQEIYEWRYE